MKNLFSLLLLLSLFIAGCNNSKKLGNSSQKPNPTSGVYFLKSNTLSAVLDKAEIENKVVFVDMYTNWCLPCKIMDENVFSDPGIASFMNDNFLNYKVNTEKGTGPNLRDVYEVIQYPTLLFLDSKGRVLVRKEGSVGQTDLMNLANEAMSLYNAAN